MELRNAADREYAKLYGLEIGMARLGFRNFDAVFVPCRETAYVNGREVYIDTPEEVQRRRYLELIKDEMNAQEEIKQDGRCPIPDGRGGLKRCPRRVPNPDYTPGGDAPKTLPVRCEGCKYEPFRLSHTTLAFSCLGREDDPGEIASPRSRYAAYGYEKLSSGFVSYVREKNPRLAPLAELLALEFTGSEAARELGLPTSTAGSRREKLKELCREFLDEVIL